MTPTFRRLHEAADRLEQLADTARADFAKNHANEDGRYARAVDNWLGVPIGYLAMAFTPEVAQAVADILRRNTRERTPQHEVLIIA